MLSPRIRLGASQKEDLATICAIGAPKLMEVFNKLTATEFTISRRRIEEAIASVVGKDSGAVLSRILFGIGSVFRRSFLTPEEALAAVTLSLGDSVDTDPKLLTWPDCRAVMLRLLQTRSVTFAAKALDISYDFERVYIAGRLLTSIRPVFDDGRDEVLGSTIVQTLRVEYVASDGDHSSISVAMDMGDIERLRDECERAIKKAAAAKARIELDCGMDAIIPGEESNE